MRFDPSRICISSLQFAVAAGDQHIRLVHDAPLADTGSIEEIRGTA